MNQMNSTLSRGEGPEVALRTNSDVLVICVLNAVI